MRAEKNYLIAEVETHLKKSDYVILANFTKVTVADVADLRAKLAAEKAEFHVVKQFPPGRRQGTRPARDRVRPERSDRGGSRR